MKENFIGQYCIIRANRAGVFAGTVVDIDLDNRIVVLDNARRLWYWSGAATLSQLALEGVKNPSDCKFTVAIDSMMILDVIEIIPTTITAMACIQGVPVWKI